MQLQPVTVDQTYPNGKEEEKKDEIVLNGGGDGVVGASSTL